MYLSDLGRKRMKRRIRMQMIKIAPPIMIYLPVAKKRKKQRPTRTGRTLLSRLFIVI
jgi:hypothetical protein